MSTKSLLIHFFLVLMLSQVAVAAAPITALAVSPDGQQIVVGSQAGLNILRIVDQANVRTLPTKLEHIHDVVFSPDRRFLLAVGGSPAEDGSAELYTWPEAELKQRFSIAKDLLTRAAWSNDSSWFATSGHDGICHVNDLKGQSLAAYSGHSRSVLALNVMTNKQQLLSAGIDTTIQLWSLSGERQRTLNNHTATVTDLAISNGNDHALRLASCGEDRTVRLWQPLIGRMVKFLRLETVPRRIVWDSPDKLMAAGDDGVVHIIDVDQMSVVQSLKSKVHPIYELATTQIGIVVAGEGGIELVKRP